MTSHHRINHTITSMVVTTILLLIQFSYVTPFCFTLSPINLHNKRSSSSRQQQQIRMGYLDDLSPEQQPPKKSFNPSSPSPPKKPSGGIPSGRGPMASYLDAMTGERGASSSSPPSEPSSPPSPEKEKETAFTKKEKPKSWSGNYLTTFMSKNDDSRTDIRNLLTQRALQSFMFLLEQCRDPHSAKWIQEDFLQTGNLLEYHGTGAAFIENYGGTWDAALFDMISKPKSTIIISAKKRGRGHGGWSTNNPFLEERWMEMPIQIHPASLASRVMEVREQIAGEWFCDLDVLVDANEQILDLYFEKMKREREADDGNTGEAVGDSASSSSSNVAFERTAIHLMNDNTKFGGGTTVASSSPFRRANFDLLYNLCTQAAIHRLLRAQKQNDEEMSIESVFLRNFYVDRAEEYFDGDLPYGRADDFMEELLQTSPSVLETRDGKRGLIDPLGAAEEIIRMRGEVAREWKDVMRRVSEEHTGLRQALLTDQMQYWGEEDTNKGSISGGGGVDDDDIASFQ